MARQTFQGLLRSFAGRGKSGTDKRTGLPVNLLPMNLAGPIQIVMTDPDDGAHEVGLLPAGFAIQEISLITAADAGTFAIDIPAYGGEDTENLVAAGADASGVTPFTMAAGRVLTPFEMDVPLVITTSGLGGTMRLGIFGFPLDDATQVD